MRERLTIGIDNLMGSSDYPHGESTWPNSLERVNESMAGIPENDRPKIVHDNVQKLYQIKASSG